MPHIPSDFGVADAELDHASHAWDTLDIVLQRAAAKGVIIPSSPPPFPIPAVDTTLVDSDNQAFLKTNAQYLAWLNYLTPHVTLLEMLILQYENEMTHIEMLHKAAAQPPVAKDGTKSKPTKTKEEILTEMHLDPRYIELTRKNQEATQEKRILEETREQLTRVMRVISRHVEVKKVDMELNKELGYRMNQSGRQPRPPFRGPSFGDPEE